jgi:hypothetical protein
MYKEENKMLLRIFFHDLHNTGQKKMAVNG